jgi:hypothetical protein
VKSIYSTDTKIFTLPAGKNQEILEIERGGVRIKNRSDGAGFMG